LPSFESCYISRSYEIEVKVAFERGSEIVLRMPISIIAKPGTQEGEREFSEVIRVADDWSPPEHETVAGVLEPELVRPTAANIRTPELVNVEVLEAQDVLREGTDSIHSRHEMGVETPSTPESPPDYEHVVEEINKIGVNVRITAVAA
jgi:hypothetical protein